MRVRTCLRSSYRTWVIVVPAALASVLFLACADRGRASDPAYRGVDQSGKTLLILPLDTAFIVIDASEDVVDGLPANGPGVAPRSLLSGRFRNELTEALRWRLNRSGLRIEMTDSLFDTSAAVKAVPAAIPAAALGIPAPADTAASKDLGRLDDTAAAEDTLAMRDSAAVKDTVPAMSVAAVLPRPDFTLRIKSLESRRTTTTELMPKIGTIIRRPLYFSGEYVLWDVARGAAVITGQFRVYVTGSRGIRPDDWKQAFDEAARQVAKDTPFEKRKG